MLLGKIVPVIGCSNHTSNALDISYHIPQLKLLHFSIGMKILNEMIF